MEDNSIIYRYSKFGGDLLKNKTLRNDCLKNCLVRCQTIIETNTLNLLFSEKRVNRSRNSDIKGKLMQMSIQISKNLCNFCHAAFFESPNMILLNFSKKCGNIRFLSKLCSFTTIYDRFPQRM